MQICLSSDGGRPTGPQSGLPPLTGGLVPVQPPAVAIPSAKTIRQGIVVTPSSLNVGNLNLGGLALSQLAVDIAFNGLISAVPPELSGPPTIAGF